MANLIDNLSAKNAIMILQALSKNPVIQTKINEAALRMVQNIEVENIAIDVFDCLNSIDVHELWQNSGSTADGYCPVEEVAEQMIEEELEHFVNTLARYYEMQMPDEAFEYCQGLFKGLYQYEHHGTCEFKDWSQEIAQNMFETLLEQYLATKPEDDLLNAMTVFIKTHCRKWLPLSAKIIVKP